MAVRNNSDALNELVNGVNGAEGLQSKIDKKAPLNSPALTGTPTAPTPAKNVAGSDRLATTAYVLSLLKDNPGIIDDILEKINKAGCGDFEVSGTTISAALKKDYFTNPELDPFNGTTRALSQQANHAKATLKMDDYGMMHFGASAFYFSTPDVDGEKFIEMNSGRLIIGAYESGYNGRSLLKMGDNGTSFQVDAKTGGYMICNFDHTAGTIKLSAPNGVYAGSKRLDV